MKRFTLLFALIALVISVPPTVLAEAPRMDAALALLREAKDSSAPLPLLEKAHKELKESKSAPKGTGSVGPKKAAALEASGHEHKHRAMEAIEDAIKTAKEGGDAKPKIEHAIAEVHSLLDLKN